MASLFRTALIKGRPNTGAYSPLARPTNAFARMRYDPQAVQASKRFAGHEHPLNTPSGMLDGYRPGEKQPIHIVTWLGIYPLWCFTIIWLTGLTFLGDPEGEWAKMEAERRLVERGEYPTYTVTSPAYVNFNPPHPDRRGKSYSKERAY